MSWGRDVREKDMTLQPAPIAGGREPLLLPPDRQQIRADLAEHAAAFTPEWTGRRADDAGVALVRTYGTVAEAVHLRLNRVPRKLALEHLRAAGVRPLPARSATAGVGVRLAERATAPVEITAGTVFVTPAGATGPALETLAGCTCLPGSVAVVASLAAGWLVSTTPAVLPNMRPFGSRAQPPAELWIGMATNVCPTGTLSLALDVVSLDRPVGSAILTQPNTMPPTLRWEAMTATGGQELVVEHDDTNSLTAAGTIAFRTDTTAPWNAASLPGRNDDEPLRWLRARLVGANFPASIRLRAVTLNGLAAQAARTIRNEVPEPIDRRTGAPARYRLSQMPVVPGSVVLDIADSAADPFGTTIDASTSWTEVPDLAESGPSDRVFTLDPGTGILTFGNGIAGRAVPPGYRNVVARAYVTGGGTRGLPQIGDLLSAERSVPTLTGAAVLWTTTGADAEAQPQLLVRGPATIRCRQRAVAAADYATEALTTPNVDILRACCLPAQDPRLPGAAAPGTSTVVVVPRPTGTAGPPLPTPSDLQSVADYLARWVGIAGTQVVAVAPTYHEVIVQALLIGRLGTDLGAMVSTARDLIDRWLSPTSGGTGSGWEFGVAVGWRELVRSLLTAIPSLVAVSRMTFRVDGRRLAPCTDVPLRPGELVWAGRHLLEAVADPTSERSS